LSGWQKWLEMRGETVERLPDETDAAYVRRARPQWGLVENVAHECKRFRVDKLLIEAKASGHTLAQEMARLHRNDEFPRSVELINPGAQDKRARAIQVQHIFADGMVFAPGYADGAWRDWVNAVINETAKFRGIGNEEDNLVDTTTQALRYLRDNGWLIRGDERASLEKELGRHKSGNSTALYPA
jgi:phage terminase large subunit-like protein